MALLDFAGSPHGGDHWLLPEWNTQGKITPTAIIDHSQVGSTLGTYWFFHDSTGVESHFSVRGIRSGAQDGQIIQFMDTARRADANLAANDEAISIETEDGELVNGTWVHDPNVQPWTRAQLESLRWLHDKLVEVHPTIPRRTATTPWDSPRGLGYHSLPGINTFAHPDINPWTPALGKTCPGSVRISQWGLILLPAFLHPEEEIDLTKQEFKEAWNELTAQGIIYGQDNWADAFRVYADKGDKLIAAVKDTNLKLQATLDAQAATNAKLDQLIWLLTPAAPAAPPPTP
ncbi:MAG TPA: N-acetylmuramoyl-L-alanine amidase [Actinomycetes bacterium]|jgi:hypothetical protein|nr:N-acetylmuramoyl-L-alanine amidase [Actinomycetes bacterium]